MAARICDICHDRYNVVERVVAYDLPPQFHPVTLNDRVRIKLVGADGVYIHAFDTCPDCARKILDHIHSMKGKKYEPDN